MSLPLNLHIPTQERRRAAVLNTVERRKQVPTMGWPRLEVAVQSEVYTWDRPIGTRESMEERNAKAFPSSELSTQFDARALLRVKL